MNSLNKTQWILIHLDNADCLNMVYDEMRDVQKPRTKHAKYIILCIKTLISIIV